jgi:hypothetical protein
LTPITNEAGTVAFDKDLWRMEEEISEVIGDHGSRVGFVNGAAIAFCYLQEQDSADKQLLDYLREAGANPTTIHQLATRFEAATRDLRAYAGWLLTHREFIDEHDDLWRTLSAADCAVPVPQPASQIPNPLRASADGAQKQDAIKQLHDFCARWRLARLVGPYLPLPIGRQTPAASPHLAAMQAQTSGFALVQFPDTMPIPAETEIRDVLQTAIQQPGGEHLAEWQRLTFSGNAAKKTLPRYSRIFELQHFYALLMSRHGESLKRTKQQLARVFAEYFDVSEDTIKRDLKLIQQNLGKSWFHRAYPPEP